ncbi:2-dehydropantoate 2-reductase [Ramlibacter terrae]|uniref:2-dehydropantoate 2-reductase n=1 Tax=Ramlibacter terrae TaxID=2732511 RepID=A0ABX6P6L4_9BURK|nr:2-dehydropantoate 2-reductase [Ramlibacter terrae]
MQSSGLSLLSAEGEFVVRPAHATDDPGTLPPQDTVFVTLKARAQPAAARAIASLLAPGGVAVFANNGIPWWWNHRGDGDAAPVGKLPLLDPEGALWSHVGPRRAIGCVVYSANEVVRPGVVRHAANNQWLLGEPDGRLSPRLQEIVAVLRAAQVRAEAVTDLRARIWAKLLRNAPLNSLCALTRLPVDQLALEPGLQGLLEQVIDEIAAIAAADGVDLSDRATAAKAAPRLGAAVDGSAAPSIRPSMLQDALQGRAMEVEAILGQVQQFARERGVATPVLDLLVPLVRGLDRAARR